MIAVIVQGLFEKSDSIGYDAIYQFKILEELYGSSRPVRLFAERFEQDLYQDITIESIDVLLGLVDQQPDMLIVYHFCDGWPLIDDMLIASGLQAVVRWHNNTPPWFFAATSRRSADRCTRGFDKIIRLSRNERITFWVNSEFTARQLDVVTGTSKRCHVVYPASRYIETARPSADLLRPFALPNEPLRLLFVGRIVAHKGHKHVIALASLLQRFSNREVIVDFPGRGDSSAWKFNTMLREFAASNGVTVNFLGEVNEDELRDLYQKATVFVCLSEHEGFGLPPFEAMRCGLPVVAWANTALRELLRDHPLCSQDFDLHVFAAAILALQDDKLRSKVIALQNAIAETYTPSVLRESIARAVGAGTPDSAVIPRAPLPVLDDTDLAPLHEALRSLREFPHQSAGVLEHDIPDNFVTAYDIISYTALLDANAQLDVSALEKGDVPPVAVKEVRVDATEFSTHSGVFKEGSLEFTGPSEETSEFVFGPYIKLPTGNFEVSFELDKIEHVGSDSLLHFDVYVDGKGVVARRSVFPSILRSPTVDLDFHNASASDVVEFRIASEKDFIGSFRFTGTKIRRLSTREFLPSGPPRTDARRLPKRFGGEDDAARPTLLARLTWGRRTRAKPDRHDRAAAKFFEMADRARNVASWSEAAELYRRGLELRPNVVQYVIQMAHAFKESGQLAAAELAYLGALELDPSDRDLKLQIGHFYSLTGRQPTAEHFYMEAVRGDSAGLNAYKELLRLGISSDKIYASAHDT